jgi:hypothetical protein
MFWQMGAMAQKSLNGGSWFGLACDLADLNDRSRCEAAGQD